ncbi:hypothetical protein AB0B45_44675 [Nonomuraea sp. NPDC049152]|uniref:hypothetical protein n=1 Tax=Nonomuraea sp. NPDC049152 TaxID=3154350 RepID=UPI0033C47572
MRTPATAEDLEALETDMPAGFVLARAAARLTDGTISSDVVHVEQGRAWFGRPLWEMEPTDDDTYFGKALRDIKPSTRTGRAAARTVYFRFLELRYEVGWAVRPRRAWRARQVIAPVAAAPTTAR